MHACPSCGLCYEACPWSFAGGPNSGVYRPIMLCSPKHRPDFTALHSQGSPRESQGPNSFGRPCMILHPP